ncbi:MAG: Sjogren's syndrome/scleroderma autoantigen 1 family protein [Candidatus Hecatellaceae archaeon]
MSEDLKRMAELLKSGATMLEEACPRCNSPLFKLASGEIYCAKCNQRVVVVRSEEEIPSALTPMALSTLEETLTLNLQRLERLIRGESSPEALEKLLRLVNAHLEALERVKRIRRVG